MRIRSLIALLGLATLLAGCSENSSTGKQAGSTSAPADTATKVPEPLVVTDIEMKPLKYAEFEALVAKQRGNVVVTGFWAESNDKCKKGLPHMVEMQKKHGKDGLTIITMNMDDPKKQDAALEFLKSTQIMLPNFAYDATDDTWVKAMKLDEGIVYPHVRIYDRAGKLVHDGDASHEEIEEKVHELLKK